METQNLIHRAPLVSISIVSHGDGEKVQELFESLEHIGIDSRFQIILTDNAGEGLEMIPPPGGAELQLIRNHESAGFGSNQNQAFHSARGEYFCVVNPDVTFFQDIFPRLIDLVETGGADIAAPCIVDAEGRVQDSFRRLPTPLRLARRKLPGYQFQAAEPGDSGLIHPDWIAGMFLFMKSETYRALAGFDERYRLYFEDVDLCTRARLAGFRLAVDPGIRVEHDAQRRSRTDLRYLLWHMQSALRFYGSEAYRRAKRQAQLK